MPTHSEARRLPYTARQMFNLVADIEKYPEFLPWCSEARIRSRTQSGTVSLLDADLVISFKIYREQFGSRVTLSEENGKITTENLRGPFKFMKSHWMFRDVDGGCEVTFDVDFEFRNALLRRIIGVVFNEAMQRVVRAFEKRAETLYK
ncbi:MAG: type II toxin-antitoxin system RatA family toxin [Aestuariivita sp.]|nr:type II toxin-antitoxin system RatA family toxin [Aestuariivita sp.]